MDLDEILARGHDRTVVRTAIPNENRAVIEGEGQLIRDIPDGPSAGRSEGRRRQLHLRSLVRPRIARISQEVSHYFPRLVKDLNRDLIDRAINGPPLAAGRHHSQGIRT